MKIAILFVAVPALVCIIALLGLHFLVNWFDNRKSAIAKFDMARFAGRSSGWPAARAQHLKEYPACAACGSSQNLEVHHVVPVSFDATLELVASNFITLCESPARYCHLRVGHCGNWARRNPQVVRDAERELAMYRQAQTLADYKQEAKA